jgi:hypothetical protein
MASYTRFATPRKRSALSDARSMVETAAVFGACVLCAALLFTTIDWLHSQPFWLELLVVFGFAVFVCLLGLAVLSLLHKLPSKPPIPDELGSLEIEGDRIVQFDDSNPIAEINLMSPYEYEILDRYVVETAVFRLHQGGKALTFRFSDPGAREVVRDVMGLTWPPPNRHAGRSYPPAA